MAVLRRPDGSLAFQTSDGLTVPMGERAIRELGLELPGLDPAATAENDKTARMPLSLAKRLMGSGQRDEETSGETRSDAAPPAKRSAFDAVRDAYDPGVTKGAVSAGERAVNFFVGDPIVANRINEEDKAAEAAKQAAKPESANSKERARRGGGSMENIDVRQETGEGSAPAPQAQRLQKIPGGDVRTGYTRKVGAPDEDVAATKEAIGQAGESEQKLVWQDAEFENAQRQREVQLLGEEIAAQRQSLDATKWRKQQAEERIRNETEELNSEREKVASLEQAPYSYWAGQNTFAKVMAFIGAAAGGLLAGLQGTENQFLKHLDKTIADDKAERMAKINARKKGYQVRQDALDRFAEKHDPVIAEREIEARQRLLSATLLEQHAKKTGNPLLIAKAGALADKVKAKAYQDMAQVDQELGDQIVEQIQNIPDRYVGGGAAAVKPGDIHQHAADWQAAKLTDLDAAIGGYEDLLADMPEGEELPTFASRNVVSRGARKALDYIGGEGTGASVLDSPAEQAAAEKLERRLNEAKSKELGAARSDAELADFARGQSTIKTKAGLASRVQELKRERARRAAVIRAGAKPETVQEFEHRKSVYGPRDRPEGTQRE